MQFDRDVFRKPVSITRSGTYAAAAISAVRQYVYDANQRLCKRIDPESLAEIVEYDAASNVAWRAQGSGFTSLTACQSTNVPTSSRVTYSYDAMNRLLEQATPSGIGKLTYTYTPDGLVESIASTNPGSVLVTNSYTYNRRRMLLSETVTQPSFTWTATHAYNANGHE